MSYLNTEQINKMYLGQEGILKAYLGRELVYSKSGEVIPPQPPGGYVTDGLVLHLDGADATTSQWAARIGTATFAMSNVTLDASGGVVFNGSSSYGNFPNSLGLLFSNCTIETVITYDVNDNSSQMVFATNDNGGIAFSFYNGIQLLCSQGTNGVLYYSTVKSGLHTFSVNAMRAYRDKTALNTSSPNQWGLKNGGCFIGCREIGNMQFNGTIYQIRIYNRQLSDAEILANQDIDINRYNIV